MKKLLRVSVCFLIAAASIFVLGGCLGGNSGQPATTDGQSAAAGKGPTVVLNTEKGKTEVIVEIADTRPERTKGLMYRYSESLPQDHGMFFIFEKEEALNFWMKNTLIPLDMVFFDRDYKVVSVVKNAQPCTKEPCDIYPSDKPAKFVLEVNGGFADSINLKEGDKAELII
jgi:hypothetical protein